MTKWRDGKLENALKSPFYLKGNGKININLYGGINMKAAVIFKIGETEIKTLGGVPQTSSIPDEGKRHMTVLNALSQIKRDTGIDLQELDEDITEKAEVVF